MSRASLRAALTRVGTIWVSQMPLPGPLAYVETEEKIEDHRDALLDCAKQAFDEIEAALTADAAEEPAIVAWRSRRQGDPEGERYGYTEHARAARRWKKHGRVIEPLGLIEKATETEDYTLVAAPPELQAEVERRARDRAFFDSGWGKALELSDLARERADLQERVKVLEEAMRDVRDNGLIYWEPNTSRGYVEKGKMLQRIDAALRGEQDRADGEGGQG